MSTKLAIYTDTLLYPVVLRRVNEAESSIKIMMFVMKSNYGSSGPMEDLILALIAAAARGVKVYVLLNFSQYEPDVAVTNYQIAQRLSAAGIHVRLGPKNTTLHTKLVIVDDYHIFAGSHNWTRGAFFFNREWTTYSTALKMINRAMEYFNQVWNGSTPFSLTTPPTGGGGAIEIAITGRETVGAEVKLTFTVNHTEGMDAFAAVADTDVSLAGAKLGEAVGLSVRTVSVVPEADPGDTVFVAVRAYREGTEIASSLILQMTYQPTDQPPGGGEDDGGGGGEPPPPAPLTAPTLTAVTQTAPTTVRLTWEFVGAINFDRFELQQRDLQGNWHLIGTTMQSDAREWSGTPLSMDTALPFRVVVCSTAGQSAESNMMYLQAAPPPPELAPPVLDSVVAGLGGTEITATWTFPGSENFARFEVQKLVSSEWSVVGSTLDPAVRQWVGPGPGTIEPTTYRVVVFNMAEESAASNEITIVGDIPPTLQAPVVVSATQIGPMGINVEWSHVTPAEFARYEVQQMMIDSWSVISTITTPETRSWSGGPIPYMDPTHPVRVVVFVQSGDSAASNEMAITPM